jgi:hypothetical protein
VVAQVVVNLPSKYKAKFKSQYHQRGGGGKETVQNAEPGKSNTCTQRTHIY